MWMGIMCPRERIEEIQKPLTLQNIVLPQRKRLKQEGAGEGNPGTSFRDCKKNQRPALLA